MLDILMYDMRMW